MGRSHDHPTARSFAVFGVAALALAGCSTARLTEPPQTATEQLLVSTAVDHAIGKLKPPIAPGSKVFVDAQFFDAGDNLVLPKYTIGAVRDLVLRKGGELVADRSDADLVVELRNGGQSINHDTFLVGIPAIPIPIPLAGTVETPEVALFKRDRQRGISKVALTIYRAKSGTLAGSSGPVIGDSHFTRWTVLLLIAWTTQDLIPNPGAGPPALP